MATTDKPIRKFTKDELIRLRKEVNNLRAKVANRDKVLNKVFEYGTEKKPRKKYEKSDKPRKQPVPKDFQILELTKKIKNLESQNRRLRQRIRILRNKVSEKSMLQTEKTKLEKYGILENAKNEIMPKVDFSEALLFNSLRKKEVVFARYAIIYKVLQIDPKFKSENIADYFMQSRSNIICAKKTIKNLVQTKNKEFLNLIE